VTSGANNYVNDGGNVGINTATPGAVFEVWQAAAQGYSNPRFYASSDTNWQGPFFILQRNRGTKTTPAVVVSGDTLGAFDFWGYSSAGGKRAALMSVSVDGSIGSNFIPGKFVFQTTNSAGTTATRMTINAEGRVGINTTNPGTYQLAVNGTIRAKELVIDTGWSDYVFEDDYKLMSLTDVNAFIEREGHLPGMPKASEVVENGIGVAEATTKLLEKVEELTLYVIQLHKENERLSEVVERQVGNSATKTK